MINCWFLGDNIWKVCSLYILSHFFCRRHSWPLSPRLHEQARYLYTCHASVPLLTSLHLRMHVRCWVELILWGNEAAERERGIARNNYNGIQSGSRCSPDIAYYYYSHLHPTPLIQIQIQIRVRPRRLNSLPHSGFNFTWAAGSWFNDMYTQSLLNKSSALCLHTHSTHLFFSPGHFSVFPPHSHSACPCVSASSLCLLLCVNMFF